MERKTLRASTRRALLNPEPGSALARARDYGIDLTILVRNLTLSADELLENVERSQRLATMARSIREDSARAK